MEERKSDANDDEGDGFDAEDTLVGEGDDAALDGRRKPGNRSNRTTLWVFLATTSTLMGRRVLMNGFRMFVCLSSSLSG